MHRPANLLVVDADQGRSTIHRQLYGHFAEHLGRGIYEGLWVGEDSALPNVGGIRSDVVAALRALAPPVLRWPGGCFADEYHWRDGIGPRAGRTAMVNTHWGGLVENNHFGTHEFFALCEQLGAQPYLCGNLGSGTVREMQDWIEYCTFAGPSPLAQLRRAHGRDEPWALPFFGIGNENMGCGGMMRPEYYADEFRRYQTYVRSLSGNRIQKIACGPNGANYEWTDVLMRRAGDLMDGLTLHYYAMPPWGEWKGHATSFTEDEYFETLRLALVMDELIRRHRTIMDRYDPAQRVALIVDEWGTWWEPTLGMNPDFLFQQNTMRDAIVAALTLNIFHQHCDRVRMANLAQTVNVLQALILTDGPRMLRTPTFHVFEMFQGHQDALHLPSRLDGATYSRGRCTIPALSASASLKAGRILLSVVHTGLEQDQRLEVRLRGARVKSAAGRILHGAAVMAHNTFDQPDEVRPAEFAGFQVETGRLYLDLPPAAVVTVEVTT